MDFTHGALGEGMSTIARAGEILLITKDSHDNYAVLGVYRALRDFDAMDLAMQFVAAHRGTEILNDEVFAAALTTFGYVERIGFREWNIEIGHGFIALGDPE